MAVLTLEPALPAVRQSQRGPLTACLCLLLIVMISSSGLVAHRNLDTTIPLDAVAVALGPGGALVEVAAADALVRARGCSPECRTASTWRENRPPGLPTGPSRR